MAQNNEWEGPVGRSWASEWERTDRSFAAMTPHLLRSIAGLPGRDIVDIGCGAGEVSLSVADARREARVLGIDISADLVATATIRSQGRANCAFALADATSWEPDRGAPDLYVSRHGVMFFADPVAAFAHLANVAGGGARLCFSCFRSPRENEWASAMGELIGGGGIAPGDPRAPGPFAFADRDYVAGLLGEAGWRDVDFQPVDYRYLAGSGRDPVGDALGFFMRIGPAARALRELPEAERAPVIARIERFLAERSAHGEVAFPAAAWIVTATVREAFAGQDIDLRLVEGNEIAEAVKSLTGCAAVAIGGGDGTQATAAAAFANSDTAQIVLPLGTRNHLAKQLGMPMDLGEAAKVVSDGKFESIDLAKASDTSRDRVFVNNASIGLYTKLVRERDKRWGPKWLGTIPATWIVLRTLRARSVHLTIDGKRQRVVTPLLFIGNNRYSLDAGSVGQRTSLSDGVLSLFVVAQASPLALIGFAFRALRGRADPERDFCALAEAKEVTIEGSGEIDVAFDGEVERMALPLTFAIMPGALKVLVPIEVGRP